MLTSPASLMSIYLSSTALTPAMPFRLMYAGLSTIGRPYGPLARASLAGFEVSSRHPSGRAAASALGITIIAAETAV